MVALAWLSSVSTVSATVWDHLMGWCSNPLAVVVLVIALIRFGECIACDTPCDKLPCAISSDIPRLAGTR
jgi:hypothetical protein